MKSFLKIKPKLWQLLYPLIVEACLSPTSSSTSLQDAINKIAVILEQYNFTKDLAATTAKEICRLATASTSFHDELSATYFAPSRDYLYLSFDDIHALTSLLATEQDVTTKRLLVSFAAYARYNDHPSGWIRYDKETIFCLANILKLPAKEQEFYTRRLHQQYGLDMQVVGSTQPIPCYQLSWMTKLPPVSPSENPLVKLGDFDSPTVALFVEKMGC